MKTSTSRILLILVVLSLAILSCEFFSGGAEQEDTTAEVISEEAAPPTEVPEVEQPTEADPIEAVEVPATSAPEAFRQWASTASASSEYDSPGYSAAQATGAPDTPDCGDQESAWSPLEGDGVEWLELGYNVAVIPTEINIYESHTPSQVSLVELIDTKGYYHEVYQAVPEMKIDCPYVLSVQLENIDYEVAGVKITIDQSVIELPWDEIDAVELVGWRLGEMGAVEVEVEVQDPEENQPQESTPEAAKPNASSVSDLSIPQGTLWRVSEESLGMELGSFGDIAVSADGKIYVPDNGNGILVFDIDGNLLDLIDHESLQNPVDVKIGPDGNLYIADSFADAILIFSPDGEYLSQFGESGNGPGQFGSFGPKALAVCPDGTVYTLDDNRDENDETFVRLIMFTMDGTYLGEKLIESGFPVGMECGVDGRLYVVNYFGHHLQVRDQDGDVIAEVADGALARTSPQYVAFDQNGSMYLTVWDESGIVFLDPDGNYLGRFGFDEEYDVTPWPDGAMNQPKGIAVLTDGSRLFFTDYANSQPFLEALLLR